MLRHKISTCNLNSNCHKEKDLQIFLHGSQSSFILRSYFINLSKYVVYTILNIQLVLAYNFIVSFAGHQMNFSPPLFWEAALSQSSPDEDTNYAQELIP